jgi:hypothetical protein
MKEIIFSIACIFAFPSAAQQIIDASSSALPNNDVSAVVSIMSRNATNPLAVQFRDIQRSSDPTQTSVYCGEINLPNRVGGYDGFTKFVVNITNKQNYIASQNFTAYDGVSYVASCQPKG